MHSLIFVFDISKGDELRTEYKDVLYGPEILISFLFLSRILKMNLYDCSNYKRNLMDR